MSQWLRRLLGLPEQASSYAPSIDALHLFVIITTMIGASLVALVALGFVLRWRQRSPRNGPTPRVEATWKLETVFIGGLLSLFVLWWWIGYRQYLRIQDPPSEALDVFVSAKQWMWKFAYPDGRKSIAVLVVPAGVPVKLIMASRDVIHSFYVPDFRLKRDVVPGRTNLAWFQASGAGIHQLLCAEYCGLEHSRMRGEIVALDASDWAAWRRGEIPALAKQALEYARLDQAEAELPSGPPQQDLATQGMAAAARHGCLSCHTTDGQRHIGPTWKDLYGSDVPLADGRRVHADDEYLTRSMMRPQEEVVLGFAPVMPSFQGLLDPADTAAILALMHSLRAGGPQQPRQEIPPLPAVTPTQPSTRPEPAP